ncbi:MULTISPECIES: glycogen/starch/alpha-glucan phosphorylase [Caproicibacterium]|jgi:starch phosphorylase|uniref:Alpha-1,4 glucan phosphorylase n=1 Tax=Caproicibacterium lactatifermentans TaxID=2666138 RepID=A0A859DND9_9FIRM|nr:glycogen/starch/alpha-glucan phosphorylase [Caproicibacterium lactatifermentans]ARP49466.1 alpha-glucan phosphorylase [Ruminococcaceae bacterium CPB6]MDD4806961.1 glycogen/starch/alpha-glucan phosphorylase [Oscillospiraceae bacterium]QKN23059.1 glycogen/starch/alpha-glucan family phosphorylase [Caproicibacterium lactatifermentans]QKO30335.1 glycogen/starch/alpha-glucan family phosphorylase [Caproicibacterium lactatifermentans]
MEYKHSVPQIEKQILAKLEHGYGVGLENATNDQIYKSVALIAREMMEQGCSEFMAEAEKTKTKQVYYLCMEFLLGRSLKNTLFNLGVENDFREALRQMGVKLDSLYDCEPDAGLGNGGLGRLAACFMDALATQRYPAMGYSLCYEYGIFRQKLVDGWQTELPDFWLPGGRIWMHEIPEKAVEVHFRGHVEERWHNNYHECIHKDYTTIMAVPCDMYIAGMDGKGVSRLRLWKSKGESFDMGLFNSGNYMRAMEQNAMAESITKVLYPEDNHPEGKSLRLTQQYFLVSASIQDIIRTHLFQYATLDNLPDTVAIHLNDTHPVLAIPELMRIMLDECGYDWDHAWDITTRTVAYTNHTVMKEALECWSQELFKMQLPRIYQIVEEINRRFCQQMHDIGVDGYKVGRMAPLNDGYVKMANLAVVGSHSVNGVSALHSDILKKTVFNDFYTEMPEKFTNVTNGIAHRRWLNQSNPELANLLTQKIGRGYIYDASQLKKLEAFKDDKAVLKELAEIKHHNKERLAAYIKKENNVTVDPDSIFDVQVKRMHEYKRQHLNALNILATYLWLKDNPNADFVPHTYIFGAKAAPGYYFAKQMIRFIYKLGQLINNDPAVNQKMKVIYIEDYRVTLAELLIPAADISEQISLAGTEASGTSNMKFMINGAVTLGTLDGANVEIHDSVGDDNMLLFGMTTPEVEILRKDGYHPEQIYYNNPAVHCAIDYMRGGVNGVEFGDIVHSLTTNDPYMVLADFDSYQKAQGRAVKLYRNPETWQRMCLINIANAGRFAADRAIREYADNIWHCKPVPSSTAPGTDAFATK